MNTLLSFYVSRFLSFFNSRGIIVVQKLRKYSIKYGRVSMIYVLQKQLEVKCGRHFGS